MDLISEKKNCIWNSVWSDGSNNGKVVFSLLIEVITLYIRSIVIDIKGLCLDFIPQ